MGGNQRKSTALFDSDDDSLRTSSTCESVHSIRLVQYMNGLYEKRSGCTELKKLCSILFSSTCIYKCGFGMGLKNKVGDTTACDEQGLKAPMKRFEHRGSSREKALSGLVDAFASNLHIRFAETNYITLQDHFVKSMKRGSAKEASLASRALGLLAITVGFGDNAQEILKESTPHLTQALKSGSDSLKRSSVLDCLAVITFIGEDDRAETLKSMEIMWQLICPKSGSGVSATSKPSHDVLATTISAWSFLLSSTGKWRVNSNIWQESVSFLSNLLDKDDRSIQIAACEAIALIFDIGSIKKVSSEVNEPTDSLKSEEGNSQEFLFVEELKEKIINQVRNLYVEKDLNNQRNVFQDVLSFLENGECPKTSVKLQQGANVLVTSTWPQLIQLNFLKRFLGYGFLKHMQENELLHAIFNFTPKKKEGSEEVAVSDWVCVWVNERVSSSLRCSKRTNKSKEDKKVLQLQNSATRKARSQLLEKHRMIAQERNTGHFGAACTDEDF